MGRRVRHFNPNHLDAVKGRCCLDSRFITGVADGAKVGSWPSRGHSSFTLTQETDSKRPTFSLRGQNGSPTVNFQASSQQVLQAPVLPVTPNTAWPYEIMYATPNGSHLNATSNGSFIGGFPGPFWTIQALTTGFAIVNTASSQVNCFGLDTFVGSSGRDAANRLFTFNGRVSFTTTNPSLDLSINRQSLVASVYYNASLCAVSVAVGTLSSSARNRVLAHYAYSFKFTHG
jgi:hypothetical protein